MWRILHGNARVYSDTASSELSPQAELLAALDMAGEAGVLAERPKKEKRVVHRPSGGE